MLHFNQTKNYISLSTINSVTLFFQIQSKVEQPINFPLSPHPSDPPGNRDFTAPSENQRKVPSESDSPAPLKRRYSLPSFKRKKKGVNYEAL
jgi:hypothetical protein